MLGAVLVDLLSVIDSLMPRWNHPLHVTSVSTQFGDPKRNLDLAQRRTSAWSGSRNTLGSKS